MYKSKLRARFDSLFDGTAPKDENVRSNIEMDIERMTDKTKCNYSDKFVQEICSAIKEKVWNDIQQNHAKDIGGTIIDRAIGHVAEELKRRNCFIFEDK